MVTVRGSRLQAAVPAAKMVERKHEPQFQNEAVPRSNFAIRRQGTLYNSKHWLR